MRLDLGGTRVLGLLWINYSEYRYVCSISLPLHFAEDCLSAAESSL
jgi:hypothetical protein